MDLNLILQESFRILFLINFPLVIAVLVIGSVTSTIMATTSVHEPSISYVVRLLTVLVVLYLLFANIINWLIDIATRCWK